MATVEQRNKRFRVIFYVGGQRYSATLRTNQRREAEAIAGGVDRTLMLLEQGVLQVPDGTDIVSFVLSGGKLTQPVTPTSASLALPLGKLRDQYLDTHSNGAMEENSLDTVRLHLRHFVTSLGEKFPVQTLAFSHLQAHVDRRAKKKGIRKRPLSPTTLRKEMASFRACWNWGVHAGLVKGPFPNRGLTYPKADEKPPFQTWQEIERQIERGGLSAVEQRELWDCLFLTVAEITELLASVKGHAAHKFLYPMFCFAAHTGARRSEMLRARIADVDLQGQTAVIHEKKRSREKRTSRRVPLSASLAAVLKEWLDVHPGGPHLFCHELEVVRSKTHRNDFTSITRDEANDHFKRTVQGSKWEKLRGWHVFRHSFASNCACKGIDQRLIDGWLGHSTEEMRRRYRHLFPDQQRAAIQLVFGGDPQQPH